MSHREPIGRTRREFIGMAGAVAVAMPFFARERVSAETPASLSGGRQTVTDGVKAREVEVEYAFDSPGNDPQPNGLQATAEGLWIYDQTRPPSKAYLVSYEDGKILRTLDTAAVSGGGITFDGQALWISSSYDCTIIRVDANTGKTLASFPCPGAAPVNWPNPRTSPVQRIHRGGVKLLPKFANAVRGRQGTYLPAQPVSPTNQQGRQNTGSHGLEWRDGKLWIAVPPAKTIYQVDPKTFAILRQWPTAGDRPHGLGWEGQYLWAADTNMNAFHKYNAETGQVLDKIQLKDTDPLPHGMTMWRGTMWYCDDGGVICRLKTKFG